MPVTRIGKLASEMIVSIGLINSKKQANIILIEDFSLTLQPTKNMKCMQDVNRLKLVLAEQKKRGSAMLITSWRAPRKWLFEELGVSPSTVSKWCTNSSQPDIETLAKIAKLLNVGVEELYNKRFMDTILS